jgi:glycosyltransferase involved in cell wall biosynthesis
MTFETRPICFGRIMMSIILPTYNEAPNVPELLLRISKALGKDEYEVIVVDDDSPDRTWEVAEALKKTYPNLSVIRRIGRKGLSSAVVEGCKAAKGDVLITMDSDLQHDPMLIKSLASKIQAGSDIAVASRYIAGGSVGEWVKGRRLLSRIGTFLARHLPAVHVSDPLSGFFALKASAYRSIESHLRPAGFKILLEILAFLPKSSRASEVPLVFKMREHGESKLSLPVELLFLSQLLRIALYRTQRVLFGLAIGFMLVMLLPRVIHISPLYLDSDLRAKAQETIERMAGDNGWLLSDIAITDVSAEHLEFVHRYHHFGRDESQCMRVSFSSNQILSCDD